MGQIAFENRASFGRGCRIRKANHEFMVDVQTAGIEIGRSGVNDVVDHEQFGVQDLRLVFVDFDSGPQELCIQAVARQPGNLDVAVPRKNELHPPSASRHAHQPPAKPPRWDKIGADNLHVARAGQVEHQRALKRPVSAPRFAQ